VLVIGYDPEFEDQMGLADNPKNHTLLQTKLTELGHANSQIKFVKAEAPVGRAPAAAPVAAPASKPPAAKAVAASASAPRSAAAPPKEKSVSVPFNKDDFKNDPLIARALEVFKGQIVEVRA
jgi:hypothetical protein